MSGKTFKDAEQILAKDAILIQNEIIDKIKSKYDLAILKIGSVGKKNDDEYHGDIDIAIKVNTYDDLYNIIDDIFPDNIKFMHDGKSVYVYSILYDYISVKDNKQHKVQIDFMMIHNVEYAKFRYYCPDYKNNESKYKVFCRILLWQVILNNCPDEDLPDNITRKFFIYPTGLYIDVFDKKNVFNHKTELYTESIDEIIHIPFTEDIKVEDVLTVENMWKYLHSDKFKYHDALKNIELSYFINAYKRPWEYLDLNPEDFTFTYWTADEIRNKLTAFDELNKLNLRLSEIQKG